jgi:Asp-tRNA(Asn)/Glu-tRNA(Gln) amidotransferase A subunit family amidase
MQVDGLPVGLQLIGPQGRDGDLCARQFQRKGHARRKDGRPPA